MQKAKKDFRPPPPDEGAYGGLCLQGGGIAASLWQGLKSFGSGGLYTGYPAMPQSVVRHSVAIANGAYWMARYYRMEEDVCRKLYTAARLHDIGKIMVPPEILEKPGELTVEEAGIMRSHAYWTYRMLKDVEGLGDICRWASTHHRKLNGGGYPDLPAGYFPIDFPGRLIACMDIYQALRETRPYHRGRTHREALQVMWQMVRRREIDERITKDMYTVLPCFEGTESGALRTGSPRFETPRKVLRR